MQVEKFENVPPEYVGIIEETLENDTLIQAGRQDALESMSDALRISTLAYQRARNKINADDVAEQKRKAGQNP